MDRHRLKQLRDKVGDLHRFGSPSCMREASSIMRDEFDSVLSFALELSEPKPKPKRTIADNYPAGGLTAAEPCMFCENYTKLEEQNEKLTEALEEAGRDFYDIHKNTEEAHNKSYEFANKIEQVLKELEKL